MAVERVPSQDTFLQTNELARLMTLPKKAIFEEVKLAGESRQELHLQNYLRAFLNSDNISVRAEFQQKPDPNKPLVIVPNHLTRQSQFTTEESLKIVAIASIGSHDAGMTDKHIAWIIRDLAIPPVGIGKLAREVQNACAVCFGAIAVKTEKKFYRKGKFPSYGDRITNSSEVHIKVAQNVKSGNNIGFFPEQEPTKELKQHHKFYPRFLDGLKLLSEETQLLPASIFHEGNIARVNFGRIINLNRDTDSKAAAKTTMIRIANNLPRRLRGDYV